MKRREFIGLLSASVAAPFAARAQSDRVPRIGVLLPNTASQIKKFFGDDPFGLRDLGYVEGKNVHIEDRFADGHQDRLPGLAAELVNLNVDVIVTAGEGVYAASRVTATVPIVMASAGDIVALGLAASLSHPGGNVTGSIIFGPEVMVKRLELLKEIVPSLRRAGVLLLRGMAANPTNLDAMGPTAKALNVELQPIEVAGASDYENALSAAVSASIGGLVLTDPGQFYGDAAIIASIVNKRGLPTVGAPTLAAIGVLGYGVSLPELFRRAGAFVDKILKGAKAGDIPIERATHFHLVVNLKTAKALGLEVPPTLLAGADEVIE
jgi:putative ABC transport system substrate-binding protein